MLSTNSFLFTPIHLAFLGDELPRFTQLLAGMAREEREPLLDPLFLLACKGSKLPFLPVLLDAGARIGARSPEGMGALSSLCVSLNPLTPRMLDCFELLLARAGMNSGLFDACMGVKVRGAYGPVQPIQRVFTDYGLRHAEAFPRILTALELHLPERVSAFADQRGPGGRNALHWLISGGFTKRPEPLARLLASKGAQINATDDSGLTPLHLAESASSLRLALELGATPDARQPEDGATALMHACDREGEAMAMVHLLLKAGADPLAQDSSGHDALGWARGNNRPDVALAIAKRIALGERGAIASSAQARASAPKRRVSRI